MKTSFHTTPVLLLSVCASLSRIEQVSAVARGIVTWRWGQGDCRTSSSQVAAMATASSDWTAIDFHTPERADNPMLKPFSSSNTKVEGCKEYCMGMPGARGIEVGSNNPSSTGIYSCICVWSVDLSYVQNNGPWSCHELLIDGIAPSVGLESPIELATEARNAPTDVPTNAPTKSPITAAPTNEPTNVPTGGPCEDHTECVPGLKCKGDNQLAKKCRQKKKDCKRSGHHSVKRWGCADGKSCRGEADAKWGSCVSG